MKQIAALLAVGASPLYLYGPVGTGKSCAAAAIYRHWPKGEWTDYTNPFFIVASQMTAKIAHADYSGSDGKWKHYKRCREANLLVVDDIGRRKLTDDQAEILLTIVEERRQNPTIYTSNFRPDELAEKLGDDRLASRILRGMNVVEFTGPDRRLGT